MVRYCVFGVFLVAGSLYKGVQGPQQNKDQRGKNRVHGKFHPKRRRVEVVGRNSACKQQVEQEQKAGFQQRSTRAQGYRQQDSVKHKTSVQKTGDSPDHGTDEQVQPQRCAGQEVQKKAGKETGKLTRHHAVQVSGKYQNVEGKVWFGIEVQG